MPKIIIPNSYEYYPTHMTSAQNHANFMRSARFVWCLEKNDIIILPQHIDLDFLHYILQLKQLKRDSINIFTLTTCDYKKYLLQPELIKQIKIITTKHSNWCIQACYFHDSVLAFADMLGIKLNDHFRTLIQQDFCKTMNSKSRFRELANEFKLPIPEGFICKSEIEFLNALTNLSEDYSELIIKQDYNARAEGNIGLCFSHSKVMRGVKRIDSVDGISLQKLSSKLWREHTKNAALIVEQYCENNATYTIGYQFKHRQKNITHIAKINMAASWLGIEMPIDLHAQTQLIEKTSSFSDYLLEQGYQGYACFDAILTFDKKILFTEINLRPGAEMNAVAIRQVLDNKERLFVKTERNLKFHQESFSSLHSLLTKQGLLFDVHKKCGIIVLAHDTETQLSELLILAETEILLKKITNKIKFLANEFNHPHNSSTT